MKPNPTRKYRAKAPTSSSSPNTEKAKVDFDKPPNAAGTTLSMMKDKGGRVLAVKPRPVRLRPFKRDNKDIDFRETIQIYSDKEDQVVRQTMIESQDNIKVWFVFARRPEAYAQYSSRKAIPEISKKQIDQEERKELGRKVSCLLNVSLGGSNAMLP